MWGWIQLGVWAGLYVANYLLRPKPQKPKPLTRDNLTLPRTEEGSAIPIMFGRCRVDSPILVWASDLFTKQNDLGNGQHVFAYGVNMLFVVGIPMKDDTLSVFVPTSATNPRLHNVWIGDKKVFIRHPLPGGAPFVLRMQNVATPNFFGGPGGGGGIFGTYQFFWGSPNQSLFNPPSPIGDAIAADKAKMNPAQDTSLVPGYRNQMLVAFSISAEGTSYGSQASAADGPLLAGTHPQSWSVGENPSADGYAFEVNTYGNYPNTITARGDATSGSYSYDYGGDADPAAAIYDVLTNSWSKIGLPASAIDEPSFLAASNVFKTEGHGYSRVHYDVEDGVSIISAILAQTDCALFEEPTSGKLKLKPIRADYTPALLPVFNESNIVEVEDYGIGGWKDSINEVRIAYTDRQASYKTTIAVAQSLANSTVNANRRRSKTIDYPGISNARIAALVAAREMNVLSRPLKKISLTVNRDGYNLRPGSCFKVTWSEYNLNATIFRCQRVDLGQLFDNKVVIEAVEDVFASTYQGYGYGWTVIPWPTPSPLVGEDVVEVPRWLALKAHTAGLVGSEIMARFMPIAKASTNALRMSTKTRVQPAAVAGNSTTSRLGETVIDPVYGEYVVDVPPSDFPMTFVVQTTYGRTVEPYDTTVGLVVNQVARPDLTASAILDSLTLASVSSTGIRVEGNNLILVITPTGAMEFMAFESASTSDGGVTYTFSNVWRGLLDTPAIEIPAGSRGYFVNAAMVGRRGFLVTQTMNFSVIPHGTFVNGSGAEEFGTKSVRARAVLSYPPQDMRVSAELITGVLGQPSVAGQYKSVSFAEEGLDLYGRIRERTKAQISRGNDADETLLDTISTVTHFPFVTLPDWPFGVTDPQGYGVGMTDGGVLTHATGALAGCLYVNGHGTAKVALKTKRTLTAGDPLIGSVGLALGDVLTSWDGPAVTCELPCWRNLCQNPRFRYPNGSGTTWWSATDMAVTTGTFSVTRKAADKWVQGNATSEGRMVQTLEVTNYKPRNLSLIVWGYFRNANADTNDTASLQAYALNSVGGTLASNIPAGTVPPASTWEYRQTVVTCPNLTTSVRLRADFPEVAAGGGSVNADGSMSECGISLGQIAAASLNVLANSSFVGTTASWTNAVNAMVIDTVNASPSSSYVRGGAFATSEIFQEYTLPAGYECGADAVLRFWRMQSITGDAGTVKIEAMDAASTVLASATTGSETLGTLNEWYRRVLSCNVPDGSTKIRATITLLRSGGAGNSGACVDDMHLSVHKKLESTYEETLDFSTPSMQSLPMSWQKYVTEYPDNPRPDLVFSGQAFAPQFSQQAAKDHTIEWSDNVEHAQGVLVGNFKDAQGWVYAFKTARVVGGSAPCIEARDSAIDTLGAFTAANAFTVLTYFRVDEMPFSGVGCGLVGRKNLSRGWSLEIDSTGVLKAVFEGDAGIKTVLGSTNVVDGALHMAALQYDPATQQISIFTESGPEASVSTATGLGEFGLTAATCRLRIMRSTSSNDTLPGMIPVVYVWNSILSEDGIASHWNFAKPPSPVGGAFTLAYTRNRLAWSDIGRHGTTPPTGLSASDRILCPFSTNQYAPSNHNAAGQGVAMGKANTNLIPSFDFAGASWVLDAGATKTLSHIDPTGKTSGVEVSATLAAGFKVIGLTFGATTTTVLVFYAKAGSSQSVAIDLMNASDVVKNTQNVTIGTTWSRHVVNFTGWDASTPTARLRWRGQAGAITFKLAHVMWCDQGTEVPLIYQGPALAITDTTVVWTKTFVRQLNSEGEVVISGLGLKTAPGAAASIVTVRNVTNDQNRREITASSTGVPTFNHYDAAGVPVNVTSVGSAFDWAPAATAWEMRGRWCRASTTDNAATPFAGLVVTASVNSAVYGRTATFSESSTRSTVVEVNKGASAGTNFALKSLTVRTRERFI